MIRQSKRSMAVVLAIVVVLSVLPIVGLPQLHPPAAQASGTVHPYPFNTSGIIPEYTGYTVSAGGESIRLYGVDVNNSRNSQNPDISQAPVAMFDMDGGPVTVTVARTGGFSSAVVRPARKGATASVSGGVVTITLPSVGNYSVEFNGSATSSSVPPLSVFANPKEDPTGTVWSNNTYTGEQNVSGNVWLAAGSIINGSVNFSNGGSLRGRGIITGGSAAHGRVTVETWDRSNLRLDGVHILNPARWAVQFQRGNNFTVENVKIITARANGDGISLQSVTGATINNCYIRSWDDNVVVKNYQNGYNSGNINVTNSVFWNDLAQAMEIGVETNKGGTGSATIQGVHFNNIDVIHAFHKAPISIHNGDRCSVSDITFRNIAVENSSMTNARLLIDFTNLNGDEMGLWSPSGWTTNPGTRSISGVTVEDVCVHSANGTPRMRFQSNDQGSFSNVQIRRVCGVGHGNPLGLEHRGYNGNDGSERDLGGLPAGVTYTQGVCNMSSTGPTAGPATPTPDVGDGQIIWQGTPGANVSLAGNGYEYRGAFIDGDNPQDWGLPFTVPGKNYRYLGLTFTGSNTATYNAVSLEFDRIILAANPPHNNAWEQILLYEFDMLSSTGAVLNKASLSGNQTVYIDLQANSWRGAPNILGAVLGHLHIDATVPGGSSPSGRLTQVFVTDTLGAVAPTPTPGTGGPTPTPQGPTPTPGTGGPTPTPSGPTPTPGTGGPTPPPQGPTPTPFGCGNCCIDYSTDPNIMAYTVDSTTADSHTLNLLQETFSFGFNEVTAYTVNGKTGKKPFTAEEFSKLLGKDLELTVTVGGQTVAFPKINKRPDMKAFNKSFKPVVNYKLFESGGEYGQWTITPKADPTSTVSNGNLQLMEAGLNAKNKPTKMPNANGWGKFKPDGGVYGGVCVRPVGTVNGKQKVLKTTYYIRMRPLANPGGAGIITPASKPKKISASSTLKSPKFKIKNNQIKAKENTYLNGILYDKGTMIAAAPGDIVRLGVPNNGKKPATATQTLTQ